MTKTTTDVQTSKYFQSSVKEEEHDSEEDFVRGESAAPLAANKEVEKDDEGEDESEEDEDDWEEVEGTTDQFYLLWLCRMEFQ